MRGVVGLVMLPILAVWPALAARTAVTNTNDSGQGPLRDAITSVSPDDTIVFGLPTYPATITLSSILPINASLTISGPGASNLAISGNPSVRVLQIASAIAVTVSGVTIENGYSSGRRGGILCYGTVTLTNRIVPGTSLVAGMAGS